MDHSSAGLTLAVALAAGVLAQSVARVLRLPGIVLLLAAGVALGPDGARWIAPQSLGEGLFDLVDFGVAVILFEGGLNLEGPRLRRRGHAIRGLITIGALATLLGGALAARLLLGWPWSLAILFGSLVVVTGPTVVTPLLRDMRLNPRLKTVLEAEGVLIDPIGALLAVVVLEIVLSPGADTYALQLRDIVFRLGGGAGLGIVGGLIIGWVVGRRYIVPPGFGNIFTLAFVVLLFHGSDALLLHSGIVAVTVAGVVVGNMNTPVDRDLREFKDQLTILLVGLLFVLLAADVGLESVTTLGWEGLSVVVALILVVRPVAAWLSTIGSSLAAGERLFVAWLAPRGIVAAAVASITASALGAQGIDGGDELRALVFLTIAVTVVLAGVTARPIASLLGVRLPGRDRVAILGAQGLGLALGAQLRNAGVPVVFLDGDPRHCRAAENEKFPVVFGDALDERTLVRAQFELVGSAIGVTFNEHFHATFVGQARELFQVPRVYVATEAGDGGGVGHLIKKHEALILFDGPHDQERWDVRFRHGEVDVERFVYEPPEAAEENPEGGAAAETLKPAAARGQEQFVLLTVTRGKRTSPMHVGFKLKKGDVAAAALFRPQREEALRKLAQLGWQPAPAEAPAE